MVELSSSLNRHFIFPPGFIGVNAQVNKRHQNKTLSFTSHISRAIKTVNLYDLFCCIVACTWFVLLSFLRRFHNFHLAKRLKNKAIFCVYILCIQTRCFVNFLANSLKKNEVCSHSYNGSWPPQSTFLGFVQFRLYSYVCTYYYGSWLVNKIINGPTPGLRLPRTFNLPG